MARSKRKGSPKKAEKKAMGRPSKFTEVIHQKVVELAEAGHTEDEIAHFIGVHPNTILAWKRKDIDFSVALKKAKYLADQLVEASLFRRACGYSHPAVKHFVDKQVVEDEVTGEKSFRTVIIEKEYIEHYPPDTVACIFWLKNRQPERWREKPPESPDQTPKSGQVIYDTEWGSTQEQTAAPTAINRDDEE